jgi:hypothetical protein
MTTHTAAGAAGRPTPSDPVLLLLVAAAAVLEALALLLRPLLAHVFALALTTAGWQPARPRASKRESTAARIKGLAELPVRELRQLAREAGHRALARSGRRSDLLLALAA